MIAPSPDAVRPTCPASGMLLANSLARAARCSSPRSLRRLGGLVSELPRATATRCQVRVSGSLAETVMESRDRARALGQAVG
jgi:hypothetical protein